MGQIDLPIERRHGYPSGRTRCRLPAHCRSRGSAFEPVQRMKRRLRRLGVATVCEEARCPNLGYCFGRGTVTFMLLGSVCTRTCRFCNVGAGRPDPVDPFEPERVASAVGELGLSHVVLTSVSRDDLPDGGADQFVRTVQAIRAASPRTTIELLTPDFRGDAVAIDRVIAAAPDVYGHNLETVPRLYGEIRPGASYRRSLGLLARAKQRRPLGLTKSGLMLGLGESREEVREVLRDLRLSGVELVTLGQYLRPTLRHLEVDRYLGPEEFEALRADGLAMGFRSVTASPLARSSFEADLALELIAGREKGDVAL